MYTNISDKKPQPNRFYRNLSMTSSLLFCAVCSFSWVTKGLDRPQNWLELDHVDCSTVSFYTTVSYN